MKYKVELFRDNNEPVLSVWFIRSGRPGLWEAPTPDMTIMDPQQPHNPLYAFCIAENEAALALQPREEP